MTLKIPKTWLTNDEDKLWNGTKITSFKNLYDVFSSAEFVCSNVITSNEPQGLDVSYLISPSRHAHYAFVRNKEWLERIQDKNMCST